MFIRVSLSAVVLALSTCLHAADWPGFLGPNRDARSTETGLRLRWGAAGPPVLWHVPVGEGYAAPAVAAGRAYLFDRVGDDNRLRDVDAATGKVAWTTTYATDYVDSFGFSDGPRATPVVTGETVCTYGAEGRLRCHRTADGALRWEVDTTARFGVIKNFFGVGSTPWIEGDLLIAVVGGSPPDGVSEGATWEEGDLLEAMMGDDERPTIEAGPRLRGNGTGLVAFDLATGAVRWRASDDLAGYASPVVTELGGRRRGVAYLRRGLTMFDPATGAIDFEFPWRARKLYSVNASNPVVVGDTIFLSESYGPGSVLVRVVDGTPRVVWKDPPRDKSLELHWSTAVHHEGHLYASSGESAGEAELRCVRHADGAVLWREPGLGRSTLTYVDGHLIVLQEEGRVVVVEATPAAYRPVAAFAPRGRVDGAERPLLTAPAWNAPALADGRLYLRGRDRMVCLDLREPAPEPAAGSR